MSDLIHIVRHYDTAGAGALQLDVSLEDAQVSTHPFQLTVVDERIREAVLCMSHGTVRELADAIYKMLYLVDNYESEDE